MIRSLLAAILALALFGSAEAKAQVDPDEVLQRASLARAHGLIDAALAEQFEAQMTNTRDGLLADPAMPEALKVPFKAQFAAQLPELIKNAQDLVAAKLVASFSYVELMYPINSSDPRFTAVWASFRDGAKDMGVRFAIRVIRGACTDAKEVAVFCARAEEAARAYENDGSMLG